MNVKVVMLMILCAFVVLGISTESQAAWNSPVGSSFLVSAPYVPPSVFVNDNLPFYALYPPVYYSYPVRYPYGFTPFAQFSYLYGAGYGYGPVCSAAPPDAPPVSVKNPYVTAGSTAESVAESRPKPLKIINPYVVAANESTPALATTVTARRQVVYPMAWAGLTR